jgi:hypothetical protein
MIVVSKESKVGMHPTWMHTRVVRQRRVTGTEDIDDRVRRIQVSTFLQESNGGGGGGLRGSSVECCCWPSVMDGMEVEAADLRCIYCGLSGPLKGAVELNNVNTRVGMPRRRNTSAIGLNTGYCAWRTPDTAIH